MTCRKCGREVGEVRVGDMVLYGHKQQPHPSHRVRLARTTHELGDRGSSEGPATRREVASSADPSSLMTNGTRAASKGRHRTASPPVSQLSGQARRAEVPPPRSALAPSAGRSTAGDHGA